MKNQFKVPPFVSDKFNSLDTEGKKEFIQRYKRWEKHEITEMFIGHLNTEYKKLVQEDERESDFLSWFSFSYKKARNRAQRLLLRNLIHKINS